MEDASIIRLAIKQHKQSAADLLGVLRACGRPWAEESLARRAKAAADALGTEIARELRMRGA